LAAEEPSIESDQIKKFIFKNSFLYPIFCSHGRETETMLKEKKTCRIEDAIPERELGDGEPRELGHQVQQVAQYLQHLHINQSA
jgi:hypothetical protein